MGIEIYKDPQFAGMFRAVPGGLTIQLDKAATQAIVDNYRGPKSKRPKVYILITLEGNLDRNWAFEHDWERVVRRTTEAPLIAYNAQTKRTSRPVWHAKPEDRTLANLGWERVKLVGVERIMDNTTLPAHARLFDN